MKQLINTNADISYHSLSRVTVFHNLLRKSRFAYTEELPFYICNFSFVPSCICMRPIHYRLDDQVLSLFRASFREESKVNRCFVLQNFRRAKKSGIIFSATESTFSSDSRQSMKRRITAKHLPDAPNASLAFKCKKGRRKSCICKKVALQCTQICFCEGGDKLW